MEHLTARPRTARRINPLWYLLLLLPFIGVLSVPLYAGGSPAVLGVPFFYWYQFVWVAITAALTAIVYRATT